MDADSCWDALTPGWRACLEEAWTSWSAGSAGVGCVVVGAEGDIVATGRNRSLDQKTVPYELAGTPIAHAETVALSSMSFGDYAQHTLLTSFEPCLMCASAILFVGIGSVEYASADPVFEGLDDWFGELEFAARRRPARRLLGGHAGSFAHLLHVSWMSFWLEDGPVIDAHRRIAPEHLDAARQLADDTRLRRVADQRGSASDALRSIWDVIDSVTVS